MLVIDPEFPLFAWQDSVNMLFLIMIVWAFREIINLRKS
jgi:hypothetical protein